MVLYEPIFCRKWDVVKIMSIPGIVLATYLIDEAKQAAEDGTMAGARAGISVWHANAMVFDESVEWPEVLDYANTTNASITEEFFVSVLSTAITDSRWYKDASNVYVGPNTGTYTYTSSTGVFQ